MSGTPALQAEDNGADLINSLKNRSPIKRWKKRVEKNISETDNVQEVKTVNTENRQPAISDQYPLILKPSIIRNSTPKIKHVSQLQEDNFRDSVSSFDEPEPKPLIKNPGQLKKITEIEPFYDYFPDQKEGEDPCRYLCPRPEGCPEDADGQYECPAEVVLSNDVYPGRHFGPTVFHWEASNLKYNPLYFEDAPLERYGHTWPEPVQPFVSVGKFGLQLVGLPYQMALDPLHKDVYPLGWYRPGECAPKKIYQIPLNGKAAAVEAGVITGLFFLVP